MNFMEYYFELYSGKQGVAETVYCKVTGYESC